MQREYAELASIRRPGRPLENTREQSVLMNFLFPFRIIRASKIANRQVGHANNSRKIKTAKRKTTWNSEYMHIPYSSHISKILFFELGFWLADIH